MKIYIAGKITGLPPEEAEANFKAAADALRMAGHEPLCPTEMCPVNPVWDWAEYMLADLRIIWHHADAVLMLSNWMQSDGARVEQLAAEMKQKPIFYSLDEVPGVDGGA